MFTALIENLAQENNILIKQMLEELNISAGAFSNWKKRKTVPSGTTVAKIAQYFNVTADYLLGISDSPTSLIQDAGCTVTKIIKDPVVGDLTEQERMIIKEFRNLDLKGQFDVINTISDSKREKVIREKKRNA